MFEWLADPTVWAGLFALIALEIVLGIDNLVFIAVLAEKLPPHQRDKARIWVCPWRDAPDPVDEHRLAGDPDQSAVPYR